MTRAKASPGLDGSVLRAGVDRRDRFARVSLAAMPLLAIALLALMIGALMWYLDRDERARARISLLTDALWVEQTLRFQLGIDEDALARLALDSGRRALDMEAILASARQLISNSPEVQSISWLDGDGTLRLSMPPTVDLPEQDLRANLMKRASGGSIRPVYGTARRQDYGMIVFDMAAPVAGGAGRGGIVVATVSVDALLARHVPWWIAENYDVRLVDAGGNAIATKSRIQRADDGSAHEIAFDPPMPGVTLQIAPHRKSGIKANALLVLAVFGLALAAMVFELLGGDLVQDAAYPGCPFYYVAIAVPSCSNMILQFLCELVDVALSKSFDMYKLGAIDIHDVFDGFPPLAEKHFFCLGGEA